MVFGGDYASNDLKRIMHSCVVPSSLRPRSISWCEVVLVRGNHDRTSGTHPTGMVYDGADYKIYVLDNSLQCSVAPTSPRWTRP